MSVHFHVVWNGTTLDWERHATREAAEARAWELARQGEKFTIETLDDNECPKCRGRHHAKPARCKCGEHPAGRCRRAANGVDALCESCREGHKPRLWTSNQR